MVWSSLALTCGYFVNVFFTSRMVEKKDFFIKYQWSRSELYLVVKVQEPVRTLGWAGVDGKPACSEESKALVGTTESPRPPCEWRAVLWIHIFFFFFGSGSGFSINFGSYSALGFGSGLFLKNTLELRLFFLMAHGNLHPNLNNISSKLRKKQIFKISTFLLLCCGDWFFAALL